MDLHLLKKPFDPKYIEWRIGRAGVKNGGGVWARALAYITSRAVHDRLDDVCGVEHWQLRYIKHGEGTVCEIGIKINDEWIWKAGGAAATQYEAYKGELSGAEKRAAVPWGIGRYLYDLPEIQVETSLEGRSGWNYQKNNDKTKVPTFYWKTPMLPAWALPEGAKKQPSLKKSVASVYTPEQLRDRMMEKAENLVDVTATQKQRGFLVGRYNDILGGDTNRYEVCEYLFGQRKSSALSQAQILVALNHLNADEGKAERELKAVLKFQADKG